MPTAALACQEQDPTPALLVNAAAWPLPLGDMRPALFVPDAAAAERFFDFGSIGASRRSLILRKPEQRAWRAEN